MNIPEAHRLPQAVIPYRYLEGYRTLERHFRLLDGNDLALLKREGLELNDGKLHVLYYAADLGGCGYYRAFTPAEVLQSSERVAAYPTPILNGALAHWAHVIVWQRTAGEGSVAAARKLKGEATFVFDLYDDLFSIPHWNPASKGMLRHDFQARLLNILRMSDHITTTNDTLGEKLQEFHRVPYTVIPNCVPHWRFKRQPVDEKTIRIGWAGSVTHLRDLEIVLPEIARLQKEYQHVVFVVMGWSGNTDAGNVFDRAGIRYEYHEFVQPHRYADALAALRLDIGIAPLMRCAFNESKSPIKWEEYSALAIPTVASPVGPYRAIEHGVTGLLASNSQDFYRKLKRLVTNEDARLSIGLAACFEVDRSYGALATRRRLESLFLSLPIPTPC